MTILVTGGAGFIGSNLIDVLIRDHNIICIDNFDAFYSRETKENNIFNLMSNHKFKFINCDILVVDCLNEVFKNQEIDLIIHLAAKAGVRPSIQNPSEYFDTNINGTLNVLNLAKDLNVKNFIFASSSSVYGNNRKVPFSENDNVDNPISPYAASKRAGELICYTYHHLFQMNIACLRFFTVYGKRQRPDLAIAKFTDLIMKNKSIPIYGDGTFKRDFTYIDDIIDGIIKCANWLIRVDIPKYEIFNLGESETHTVLELIKIIEDNLQVNAIIEFQDEQPGDVKCTYADISKACDFLDYHPTTKIEDGIKEYIKWKKLNF